MLKRGHKGHQDIYEKERESAKLFSEVFPKLDTLVIRMTYYQKGDNPVLMTRTLHVYPAQDPLYFYIPCLIHDCDGGRFEMTPLIISMLKASKTYLEGVLKCKGSETKDIDPDHGHIEYQVEASYKTATMMAREKKAMEKAGKEAAEKALRKNIVPEKAGARKAVVEKKASASRGKTAASGKKEASKKASQVKKAGDAKKPKSAASKTARKKSASTRAASGKAAGKASKTGSGKAGAAAKSKARPARKKVAKKTGSSTVKKSASTSKTRSGGAAGKKTAAKSAKKTVASKSKKKSSVSKSSSASKKKTGKTKGRK